MTKKMYVHYDTRGDFLEIRFGKPTPSYYDDLGNDTFQRIDEKTGKIKGYAFFNIQKRKKNQPRELEIDLPVAIS